MQKQTKLWVFKWNVLIALETMFDYWYYTVYSLQSGVYLSGTEMDFLIGEYIRIFEYCLQILVIRIWILKIWLFEYIHIRIWSKNGFSKGRIIQYIQIFEYLSPNTEYSNTNIRNSTFRIYSYSYLVKIKYSPYSDRGQTLSHIKKRSISYKDQDTVFSLGK